MRDQAANQRQPHGAAARYFTLGFSPAAVETRKKQTSRDRELWYNVDGVARRIFNCWLALSKCKYVCSCREL